MQERVRSAGRGLAVLVLAGCAHTSRVPATVQHDPAPVAAALPPRVMVIAAGGSQTCALFDTGKARCWGHGLFGGLGRKDYADIGDDETPAASGDFDAGGTIAAISVGTLSTCVLLTGGRVRCSDMRSRSTSPNLVDIDLGGRAVQVSAGHEHACALLETGSVRCWGAGGQGALGYGNRSDVTVAEVGARGRDVDVGGKVVQVEAGDALTCALLESHAVRCWGMAPLGYQGLDGVGGEHTPAWAGDIDLGGPARQIAVGGAHACALLERGTVRCWGPGNDGQLGYGNEDAVGATNTPASAGDVAVGGKVTQISAGDAHTCALLDTGAVRCWGAAGHGRLGYGNHSAIGDDEPPASAGDVPVGAKAQQIVAGGDHTCALLEAGTVRCWGVGGSGQLGYGNPDDIGAAETPAAAGDVPLFDPARRVSPRARHAEMTAQRAKLAAQEERARAESAAAALAAAPATNERKDAERVAQRECEEACPHCSVLYDSRAAFGGRGRKLSQREHELVLRAYRNHLTTGQCAVSPERLPASSIGGKD
ncbi:MAG TPA: hypothetical protein VNW92_10470, partial [Polyangiaceae bacterium]|nr:hypothetical protein [Polyangiaceae bacterium]